MPISQELKVRKEVLSRIQKSFKQTHFKQHSKDVFTSIILPKLLTYYTIQMKTQNPDLTQIECYDEAEICLNHDLTINYGFHVDEILDEIIQSNEKCFQGIRNKKRIGKPCIQRSQC